MYLPNVLEQIWFIAVGTLRSILLSIVHIPSWKMRKRTSEQWEENHSTSMTTLREKGLQITEVVLMLNFRLEQSIWYGANYHVCKIDEWITAERKGTNTLGMAHGQNRR